MEKKIEEKTHPVDHVPAKHAAGVNENAHSPKTDELF